MTGATDNAATVDEITLSPDSRKLSIDSGVLVLVSDGLACDLFINVSDVDNALAKVPVPDVNWSHAYNDSFEALPFHSQGPSRCLLLFLLSSLHLRPIHPQMYLKFPNIPLSSRDILLLSSIHRTDMEAILLI